MSSLQDILSAYLVVCHLVPMQSLR